MGRKWVRRSKILSGLNLNMVKWDPVQKQGKNFFEGHRSTFWIKMQFGIGHPHLHINCSLHVWGRAQGSQIFKRNSIISIRSKVMAFLVILLSPCGPHRPRIIHVVPVLSLSSPHHPHHPHSPQKVPMWSPWSVVSIMLVPIVPTSSTSSPCHPCHPHSPQKVPMWSPMVCGLHMLSPSSSHIVPVVPVIPTSSRRSPHHLQTLQIPIPPTPHPPGGWGPQISKNAIRFELIKIF